MRPLAGAEIEAAGSCCGCGPYVVVLYSDSVNDVITQTGVQLRVGVDATGRDAAEATHGANPEITRVLVERQRKYCLVRQAICRAKDFPGAVLIHAQTVVGAGPDALAID